MQKILTMCDVCGSQEDAVRCVVVIGHRRRTYDLCREHRGPLEELATRAQPRRSSVLDSTPFVESVDDLETLRKQIAEQRVPSGRRPRG